MATGEIMMATGEIDGQDHDGTPFRGVNLLCLAGPEGPQSRVTEVMR